MSRSTTANHMALFLASTLLFLPSLPARADDSGAALYKAKCAPCHGADGSGQTPVGKNLKVSDLRSAEVQKQSDADMTKVLTDGKGKMPKSKLAAGDMKAVIGFVRSLTK